MKHTLLATTALVAMTGAAAAELTISGSGRLGLISTEGHAAADAVLSYQKHTTNTSNTLKYFTRATVAKTPVVNIYGTDTTALTPGAKDVTATSGEITELDEAIAEAKARLLVSTGVAAPTAGLVEALVDTTAERTQISTDIATMESLRAQLVKTTTAAKTLTADTTSASNRFRVSFAGSGETDSGISYGFSGRAEQSDTSTAGSQYISGAFGKISMGDLDGADEVAAGGGVSGVGLSGLGDLNDTKYQSSGHNLGYAFSSSGFTFAYSQDTTVTSGSNSAMGLKYSGDLGGATLTIGLGQSDVGTSKQTTMSAGVSSGGLTVKAATSTNDNGPAVAFKDGAERKDAQAYVADTQLVANNDTDQTSVSISYAMDAMSVTAFSRTVSTTGTADLDYSGFGFTYDMGGLTLKAGVVDNNDKSVMDLGVSFSF